MDQSLRSALLAAADAMSGEQPWQCVHHDMACPKFNRPEAIRTYDALRGLYERNGNGDRMPSLNAWIAEETAGCRPGDPRQEFPDLWELIDRVAAYRASNAVEEHAG